MLMFGASPKNPRRYRFLRRSICHKIVKTYATSRAALLLDTDPLRPLRFNSLRKRLMSSDAVRGVPYPIGDWHKKTNHLLRHDACTPPISKAVTVWILVESQPSSEVFSLAVVDRLPGTYVAAEKAVYRKVSVPSNYSFLILVLLY